MRNIFNIYIKYFLVTLLIGLVPLLWFKGLPIAGEEYYALNYAEWGRKFADSWFNSVNWGEYSPLSSFKFQGVIFSLLFGIGLTRYLALLFWYVGISVLTIGVFYWLLYSVFGKKYPPFLYMIASAYYLLSPFFLNISVTLSPPKLFFLFLPVIFILLVKWIKQGGISINDVVLLNIVLFLASPIFVNIPLGLVLLGTVIFNIFSALVITKVKWQRYIVVLITFFGLYFLLNIWWLIPTYSKQMGQSQNVKQEAASFVTVDKSSTVDVLSLFGSWAFREKIFNTEYYYFPFNKIYDSFPGALIRYIPYVLTIFAVYAIYRNLVKSFGKDKSPLIFYLLLIHFVFLFLSKGTSEPFSFIYKLLYEHFPFFWMFREPYAKFAPVATLTTSVFMVYGLGYLYNEYQKKLPKSYFNIASAIGVLAFLYYAQPFLNGTIIWDTNFNTTRSYHVKVPQTWEQISREWQPNSGYYYQFPSTDIYDSYNWESGYNGNPFLMLTDAKLLNPEHGYSASENTERKYVTSYLYSLIINNPRKLIEDASRYNLSGILLQKDTVYNNYKYAFSVIQKKYEGLLGFNNDSVSVYTLLKDGPSLIDIVSQQGLLNLKSDSLPYYHLIREVSDVASLINISTDTTDYQGLSPQGSANNYDVSYEVPANIKGQNLYIYGNTDNILTVTVDGKSYPAKLTGNNYTTVYSSEIPNCCEKVTITTKNGILSGGSSPLVWGELPVFSPDIKNIKNVNTPELAISPEKVYLSRLPFFDPSKVNHIQFSVKGNYNYPIGVSLVQVDTDTLSTRYFANYQVQDISKPLTIVYDGVVNSLTNIFEYPQYYIAVYGMKLTDSNQKQVEYPKDIKYTLNTITVVQERIPYIFSLPVNGLYGGKATPAEYKQINNSVILVKLPSTVEDNSLLHFKNSHNSNWKMISINESQFNNISKNGLKSGDIYNLYKDTKYGKSPLNIEYYSNGWKINKSDSNTYVALVFVPSLIQAICFIITKIAVAGILGFYVFQIGKKLVRRV